MSQQSDTYPTLQQRTDETISWGADTLVSVHINTGSGMDYEKFCYKFKYHKLVDTLHKYRKESFTEDRGGHLYVVFMPV